MKIFSTSNLVLSENKKKADCNFQIHEFSNHEFFLLTTWLAKWEPMQIRKHQAICNFFMAELWKSALRNTYTHNSKIKTDQQ